MFDFGVNKKLDGTTGTTALNIAVGAAGQETDASRVLAAMQNAIDESANEVCLLSLQDIDVSGSFTGMYLIHTSDTLLDSDAFIVRLVGANVSGDDRLVIANGNVSHDIS